METRRRSLRRPSTFVSWLRSPRRSTPSASCTCSGSATMSCGTRATRRSSDSWNPLKHAWAYDLAQVATAIQGSLKDAAGDAVVRWASSTLPKMAHARLSQTLRILGAAARENARQTETAEVFRKLERELGKCRSAVEQVVARVAEGERTQIARAGEEISARVRRLFMEGDPPAPRESDAWTAIFRTASVPPERRPGTGAERSPRGNRSREAARAAGAARRRTDAQGRREPAAGRGRRLASGARCGIALYRPVDLDKLAESNYLELKFSRDLHWTAFLTAIDLIENHARMLWRLLESQLTAAPLEARFQLMHRLAGEHALTGRHADQLRALSAPDAVFLTIEPDYDTQRRRWTPTRRPRTAAAAAPTHGTRSPITLSGCRRSTGAPPSWRSATRSPGSVWSECSRRWTRSASRREPTPSSPRASSSGWRDAAACSATTSCTASASSWRRSSRTTAVPFIS